MAEEKPSDLQPIIAEENPLDVKPIIAEESPSDVKLIISEENASEIIPIMAEQNPLDIPPVMSEEEKDIPEIHEITEPEESSRRFSTGVLGAPDGKSRVRPRYLENSVGSCHDFCKYGLKHNNAIKPWKLARKKKTVEVQSEGKNVEQTETSGMRRKKLGSSNYKTDKHDEPTTDQRKQSISLKKGSSGSKEIGLTVKCGARSSSLKGGSRGKRSSEMGKIKEIDDSSSAPTGVSGKGEAKCSKQRGTGQRDKKKGLVSPSVSSSPKISIKKVSRINAKNDNGVSLMRNLKNVQRTKPEPASSEDVPEKTLYVVESSIERKIPKSAISRVQRGALPSSMPKKITRSEQNGVNAPKRSSLSPSSKDKGPRTTKLDAGPMRLTSKSKSIGNSRSSYERKEKDSVNHSDNLKVENKGRPKRSGIKITPPTQKLSFRRGKVVNVHPEDSTPRRLKFKRRVLQENPNGKGDGQRKNLKNKEASDGKMDASEVKPEKVVLRHRKVEGKKQLQTLFNNVIEETASKFAEGRKSKVKALVGAFETVISLQDSKSSPKIHRRSSLVAKG